MPTDDSPKIKFRRSALKFYELIDEDEEWVLFCSINAFDRHLYRTRYSAKVRDWSFWLVFHLLRRLRNMRQQIGLLRLWRLSRVWRRRELLSRLGEASKEEKPKIHPWIKRLSQWQRHLDVYFDLSSDLPNRGASSASGVKRLEFISSKLGILDGKFGMLLTINGALFGFVALLLAHPDSLIDLMPVRSIDRFFHFCLHLHPRILFPNVGWIRGQSTRHLQYLTETMLQWIARIWIEGHLAVIVILALFNIWYALRGFRRIVWGDLIGYRTVAGQFVKFKNKYEAAEENERYLVISLARRTNLFRIVSFATNRAFKYFLRLAITVLFILTCRFVADIHHDFSKIQPRHRICGACGGSRLPARSSSLASSGSVKHH